MHGAAKLSAAAVPLADGEDKADLSCWRVAADPPAGIKWAARVYYMCSRTAPQTAQQREITGRLEALTSGGEPRSRPRGVVQGRRRAPQRGQARELAL